MFEYVVSCPVVNSHQKRVSVSPYFVWENGGPVQGFDSFILETVSCECPLHEDQVESVLIAAEAQYDPEANLPDYDDGP